MALKYNFNLTTLLFSAIFCCVLTVPVQSQDHYNYVVANDGSGDFVTVQEAFNAVPDLRKNKTIIYVKNGIYKEKMTLSPTKSNVTLIGESKEGVKLTFDDYASKKNQFDEEIGTSASSSFFVFGDGFIAKNITFENSAGPIGQAVGTRCKKKQAGKLVKSAYRKTGS